MAFDENVPLATNQVANDLTAMNANWEFVVKGDGTANRVLRAVRLKIEDGTDADTIKCTVENVWNGDAFSVTDNISKNETDGNFFLDSNGQILTLEAAGLTGNAVAVLSGNLVYTNTATDYYATLSVSANDIQVVIYDSSGSILDLTAIPAAKAIWVDILYITDA